MPAISRKIIHVDMDAFYASVEQRDDPRLRGKPVVVAWRGARSVVCAASYEARRFGVRSAMPAITAERLCPQAIFVSPDFERYKSVSRCVRAIFLQHTNLVEPLSLDEAYLDVSHNQSGLSTATNIAQTIRQEIFAATQLTASAGVAPNKFLAKIASDWRKPDGLFVIKPHHVLAFLAPLPVGKIPGVGKVTQAHMQRLGIHTVGELHDWSQYQLEKEFGRYGLRLYQLARGIDNAPVESDRPVQSISSEDTFAIDKRRDELHEAIRDNASRAWASARHNARTARTVNLKLKTADFRTITRSITPPSPPQTREQFESLALSLLHRVEHTDNTLYRLVGVGLSHFDEPSPVAELPFD